MKFKKLFNSTKEHFTAETVRAFKPLMVLVNPAELIHSSVLLLLQKKAATHILITFECVFIQLDNAISIKTLLKKTDDFLNIPIPITFMKGIYGMLIPKEAAIELKHYDVDKEHAYGYSVGLDAVNLSVYKPVPMILEPKVKTLKPLIKIAKEGFSVKRKMLKAILVANTPTDAKRLTAATLVSVNQLNEDFTSALSIRLLYIKRLLQFLETNEIKVMKILLVKEHLYIVADNYYFTYQLLESPLTTIED